MSGMCSLKKYHLLSRNRSSVLGTGIPLLDRARLDVPSLVTSRDSTQKAIFDGFSCKKASSEQPIDGNSMV
ncbi:hypothetical protein TNCV_2422641 [Trichonephila clavipes]|nr:hypothetical protein TNCV_2422641 [Trichonephila clavipes]